MSFSTPSPDYGTDLSLHDIEARGRRRVESGFRIDVQAKSTVTAHVGTTHVRYDLAVRAYDYLRDTRAWCPRILVVLALPSAEADWCSQTEETLVLRRCAYWLSLRGRRRTRRRKTVRILIPRVNVFSVETLRGLVASLKGGDNP
jgi:hypothetical protein